MACIRTRKKKDGSFSYQAVVRIAGQPALRETFSDKKKARAWCDAMSTAARASVELMPDVNKFRKIKMKDALSTWAQHQLCPKSYVQAIPALIRLTGDISLGNVTKDYVIGLINKMRVTKTMKGTVYCDSTIFRSLTVIRSAVRHAAKGHRVKPDLSIYSVNGIEGNWNVERARVLSDEEEIRLRKKIETRIYGDVPFVVEG